jgi:adenylate kinase
MSHVVDMPDVLAEIDHFRAELAEHFITFDPATWTRSCCSTAPRGRQAGKDFIEVEAALLRRAGRRDGPMRVSVREVLDIAGDIDGQIYMRDFKLIDQSDMICSFIPELPGGHPRALLRRRARAAARLRAHQGSLRGLEAQEAAQPVHHRNRGKDLPIGR